MPYMLNVPVYITVDGETHRLSSKEFTVAVKRYARRHGFYADLIRTHSQLRREAATEYVRDKKARVS